MVGDCRQNNFADMVHNKDTTGKVGQHASTMALLMSVLYWKYWLSAYTLSAFLLWVLSLSLGTIRQLLINEKYI